jgi:sugar transferase (PEP-CTERM system associated)
VIQLFRTLIPAGVLALLVSEFILVIGCFLLATFITTTLPWDYLFTEGNLWKLLVIAALVILGMYFQDLYTDLRVQSRLLVIQQVCLSVGSSLLIMAFIGYLSPDLLLGRWLMIIGSLTAVIVLPLWRVFYWRYIIAVLRSERVLLMGNSSMLGEVAEAVLNKPELGYSLIGYICEDKPCGFPIPCLGTVDEIRQVCAEHHPTRIVVGMAERRNRLPVQDLLEIRFQGVLIEDAADTYELALRRVCSRKIQPSQLIFTSQLGPRPRAIAIQNFYSLLIGSLGMIVFSPLMLLAAILVKVSSKGPILYRQRRVGMNGRLFNVYKFRSMYVDAEARTGAVWARKNDPRITPVGRWLRKLRLDELPQFWNVVRGDMAIVGPRPERPEFVDILAHQIPYYRQRLAVKPGITGWAQINHKYGDTQLDAMIKLEYDLYYIKHVAAALDFYIIFHTVKVMLLSRGAQ